jgi:hypothetical protein
MRQHRLWNRETEEQQEDTFQGRAGRKITKTLRTVGLHKREEMMLL